MDNILKKMLSVILAIGILFLSFITTYSLLNKKMAFPTLPSFSFPTFSLDGLLPKEEQDLEPQDEIEADKDGSIFGFNSFGDDYKKRYDAYGRLHPELDEDAVKIAVNIGLDRPFYEGAREIKDVHALPLLVNQYHYLPEGYVPEDLVMLESGHQVTSETKKAFENLTNAALESGHRIGVSDAYRSVSDQAALYDDLKQQSSAQEADKQVARAGYSEHQTGLALDIYAPDEQGYFEYSDTFLWLQENCWQYGFIIRYPNDQSQVTGYQFEPGHITYVGLKAATEIHEGQINTLEEYFAKNEME